jgi:hypothetical protein
LILRAVRHPGVLQIVARRLFWPSSDAPRIPERLLQTVSDAAYP